MPAVGTRSSKKALTLCLFQSLAGVIFGWGNSEGGGLVSFESITNTPKTPGSTKVARTHSDSSFKWPDTKNDSVNVSTESVHCQQRDNLPLPVCYPSVLLLVPSLLAPLPTRWVFHNFTHCG